MKEFFNPKGYKMRILMLIIADLICINMCSLIALLIRFDFRYSVIDKMYLMRAVGYAPLNTVVMLLLITIFKLYSSVWSYASVVELFSIIKTVSVNFVLQIIGMHYFFDMAMPRSYYVLYAVLMLCALMCSRFGYRFVRMIRRTQDKAEEKVMIVGAGMAGMALAKEISQSEHIKKMVKCFIDDNVNKRGKYLSGVPIVGNRVDIPHMVEKYQIDEIYIAIPSIKPEAQKEILNICSDTGRKVKTLPGIYQLVNEDVLVSKLREVQIEDLLGRDTVNVDMSEIEDSITGKTVVVTGGGGSIGSELCRQVASYKPKQLIIIDIYENNAYEIQQELIRKYGKNLNLVTL